MATAMATEQTEAPVAGEAHLTLVPDGRAVEGAQVAEVAGAAAEQDESDFRSFGIAILLGVLIGIPALAALVVASVLIAAPDTDPVAVAGIALWVSLFCGPFLAGTVTVGLWSSRNH